MNNKNNLKTAKKNENAKCPVCQSKIILKTDKSNKIIVCSVCDNSLFLHKTKKQTILQPFALNLGIEGNKLIPEDLEDYDEMGFDPEDFEDEED